MTPPPSESRFRVEICYPLRNNADYYKTLNWLIKRLRKKHFGLTISIHKPLTVFRGFYYSTQKKKLLKDSIILIIVDAQITEDQDESALEKHLQSIKQQLHSRLPKEEEFWITYHPVTRVIVPTAPVPVSSVKP